MADVDPEKKLIRGEDYEYPRKEKIKELSPKQKRILKMISVAILIILISYGIYYLLAPEWFYGSRVQFPKIILSWNNTTDTFILPVPENDSYFNGPEVWKAYAINSSENMHINITLAFVPDLYHKHISIGDEFVGLIYCLIKIKDNDYLIKSMVVKWKYSPEKYITRLCTGVHDDTLPYFAGNIKYNWKTYLYDIYEKHMVELYPASNFTFCWTGAAFMFGIHGNEQTNGSYNITIPYIFEYSLTVYYGKSFMGFWYDVHSISTKVFVKILPSKKNTLPQNILR